MNVTTQKRDLLEGFKSKKWTLPCVWKSRTGGYDGRGVSILKSQADIDELADVPCLLENLVDFKHELAVIVARSVSGEIKTYPVVEMEFHPTANQVEYVICPARVESQVSELAQNVARKVSNAYQHVGLLAVELFQTQDDKILVNEVAPRPHNSGHYSIEGAFYTNQFEQHIRAILDLPLGSTDSKVSAVMVNLVGHEDYEGQVHYQNIDENFKTTRCSFLIFMAKSKPDLSEKWDMSPQHIIMLTRQDK